MDTRLSRSGQYSWLACSRLLSWFASRPAQWGGHLRLVKYCKVPGCNKALTWMPWIYAMDTNGCQGRLHSSLFLLKTSLGIYIFYVKNGEIRRGFNFYQSWLHIRVWICPRNIFQQGKFFEKHLYIKRV